MDSSWFIYALGLLAQGLFSARMIVQWLISEKKRQATSPTIFWVLSITASYIFFIYGWLRSDFAIMFGQIISYYIYMWNLKTKGVWSSRSIKPVAALLLLTPIAGVVYMGFHAEEVASRLFHTECIPMWLVVYGSLGQVIFTLRFVYQFIYSHKKGESVLPKGFWIISLVGTVAICSYGIIRHDWVLCLGQSVGFITYSRNLYLICKNTPSRNE
ncbi:MAG: lipid-A-disaccharide synthase N-terminal domain-containing protein [Bacteroidales bacterium]|nr:lipid-A-disaccharide synthase N-terminal domain-containing protein [Bacteroidales bacterium]